MSQCGGITQAEIYERAATTSLHAVNVGSPHLLLMFLGAKLQHSFLEVMEESINIACVKDTKYMSKLSAGMWRS